MSHYGPGHAPPGEGTRPTPPQNRPLVGRVPSPGDPVWPIMRIAGRFFRAGGFDQVKLETGSDLMALDQLDLKLWMALACR